MALINGNVRQVEKDLPTLLEAFPQNIGLLQILMDAYMVQKKYEAAQETLKQIILMNPDVEPVKSKMLDAIAYLKEKSIPAGLLAQLEGDYRSESNERRINFALSNNFILRSSASSDGYYLYPASDTSFLRGFSSFVNEYKPLMNETGTIYGVLLRQTNLEGVSKNFYYWKQDSLIWHAEDLLNNRAYEQALPAYEAALVAHPEHFYLYKAKEHIEYMLSKTDLEIQQLYLRYVGAYEEDRRIWIEDGQLHYKRSNLARRILMPISDTEFMNPIQLNWTYEFGMEEGEVKGLYGFDYFTDLKEWRRDEDFYHARIKLDD